MLRFKEEECSQKPELIIIPMVDVMLFLLAFFVLIAGSIIPGLAMKTDPPQTVQKSNIKPSKKVVTITVTKNGSIFYGKEKLSFQELVRLLKGMKKVHPQLTVVVDADRDASVQSLVTVLDALNKAGVNSVGLLAKEKRSK